MVGRNRTAFRLEGRINEWKSFGEERIAFLSLDDHPDELVDGFDRRADPQVPVGTPVEVIVIGTKLRKGRSGMGARIYGVKLKADSPFRSQLSDGIYFDVERDDAPVIGAWLPEYQRLIPDARRLLRED